MLNRHTRNQVLNGTRYGEAIPLTFPRTFKERKLLEPPIQSNQRTTTLGADVVKGQLSASVAGKTTEKTTENNIFAVADAKAETTQGWEKTSNDGAQLQSEVKLYGDKAIKFSIGASDFATNFKDFLLTESDKFYLVYVSVYITRYVADALRLYVYNYNSYNGQILENYNTSLVGQWQTRAIKFTGRDGFRLLVGRPDPTPNYDFVIDGLFLTEISEEDFNTKSVTTLRNENPWLSGVVSTLPVTVKSVGKNIFDKNNADIIKGSRFNQDDGSLVSSANAFYTNAYTEVSPSTQYTLSINEGLNIRILQYTKDKTFISGTILGASPITFTTLSNTRHIRISSNPNNDININSIKLELGATATPYEPYTESTFRTNKTLRSVFEKADTHNNDGLYTENIGVDTVVAGEYVSDREYENKVLNADISDDLNNWEGSTEPTKGEASTDTSLYADKSILLGTNKNIFQDIQFPNGHKIYVRESANITSYTEGNIEFRVYGYGAFTPRLMTDYYHDTGLLNQWQTFSNVVTATNGGIRIYSVQTTSVIATSYRDGYMAIDMTEHFGSQIDEMTDEQIKQLGDNFDFFTGTVQKFPTNADPNGKFIIYKDGGGSQSGNIAGVTQVEADGRIEYWLENAIRQAGIPQPMRCTPNGTVSVLNQIMDVGYYDSGIPIELEDAPLLSDNPTEAFLYVAKINTSTGQLTYIDLADITIAVDRLSFTISGASDTEWYEYEYNYPPENSSLPTKLLKTPLGINMPRNIEVKNLTQPINAMQRFDLTPIGARGEAVIDVEGYGTYPYGKTNF